MNFHLSDFHDKNKIKYFIVPQNYQIIMRGENEQP